MYLGSQYFRAPMPGRELWKADLERIKESNFNTIKIWIFWGWYNHQKGKFDFEEIDQLIELAEKHGISVVPNLSLSVAPEWLFEELPEARYASADGYQVPSLQIVSPTVGGFPGLCFDNQKVREYAEEFIQKVSTRYRDCSSISVYDLWNEPHIEAVRDPSQWPYFERRVFCYCPGSIDKFRKWLDNKYHSLDNLNQKWNRRYSSWSQVFPPVKKGNLVEWLNWRMFWLDNMAETLGWMVANFRKYNSRQRVMVHTGAGGSSNLDIGYYGSDDWRMAPKTDLYGISLWGTGDYSNSCAGLDSVRSVTQGKKYWVSECYFAPRKNCIQSDPEIPGDEIRQSLWLYMAKGSEGILHWQYRTEMIGVESPNYGLLKPDGTPRHAYRVMNEVFGEIHDNEGILKSTTVPAAEVAIFFSPESYLVYWNIEESCKKARDCFNGTYSALYRNVDSIDILHPTTIASGLKKYKIIFLPFPTLLTRKVAQELIRYVKDGGMLVSEAGCASRDDHTNIQSFIPGDGLAEVFGCRRDEFYTVEPTIEVKFDSQTFNLKGSFNKETYDARGGRVIGRFKTGEPAVILNDYGKGKALLIGTHPAVKEESRKELSRFYQSILKDLGIYKIAEVNNRDVLCLTKEGGLINLVFVFNLSQKEQTATLRLGCEAISANDLISKTSLPFQNDHVSLVLPARGSIILKIEKKGDIHV